MNPNLSTERKRPLICHVIDEDAAGGGPVIIRKMMDFLKRDYDQMFAHGLDGIVADYCREQGLHAVRLPIHRKRLLPWGFFALRRMMRRTQPDVVIAHGPIAGPLCGLAARSIGLRAVVYIAHFPSFYTDWDIPRVIRNHIVERLSCRLAARVVLNSNGNHYQYMIRRLVEEFKVRRIYNAVGPERFVAEAQRLAVRQRHGWSHEHCHVVCVGRLADQKCLHWLLESWALVNRKAPEARLWLVGGGDEEPALRLQAKKLDLLHCTFLGPQPDGHHYIAAADVVAMTSLYEGHANVPLEAMVNGRPIVASAVDGVVDSLTDGTEGFLVPPGDIEGFAARLIQLIQSPQLREQMGRRGVQRAEMFHPDIILAGYHELIKELLGSSENNHGEIKGTT